MSVNKVARTLGVSKMTVYRLITRGELKAVRANGSYQVTVMDLAGFLSASAGERYSTRRVDVQW